MFLKNKLNLLAISTVSVILQSRLKYVGNDLFCWIFAKFHL